MKSVESRSMVSTHHQHQIVRDLKRQPFWLTLIIIVTGIVSAIATCYIFDIDMIPFLLIVMSGLLVGLGIEKIVTRQIRQWSLSMLNKQEEVVLSTQKSETRN
ncbi:hypothetical protein [Veronia pacifica]|uniref:Uncharacterized protein n=1 Tax=Veronia pacifica TaxID=1080227 RepID=A0A1C3EG79_9GAMM|nr:hypothetical protein [Veronia pacifica]ODA32262.1 hypothetical protein A8L45_13805 [Veronia pacifica]